MDKTICRLMLQVVCDNMRMTCIVAQTIMPICCQMLMSYVDVLCFCSCLPASDLVMVHCHYQVLHANCNVLAGFLEQYQSMMAATNT